MTGQREREMESIGHCHSHVSGKRKGGRGMGEEGLNCQLPGYIVLIPRHVIRTASKSGTTRALNPLRRKLNFNKRKERNTHTQIWDDICACAQKREKKNTERENSSANK